MKKFFNVSGKYEDVEISEHKYSEKDGLTFVNMKLCLVVKTSDGAFLDDVFIEKVKTGYLFEGFEVRKDSVEFKPLGRCQHSVSYLISQSVSQSINQPTPFLYRNTPSPENNHVTEP